VNIDRNGVTAARLTRIWEVLVSKLGQGVVLQLFSVPPAKCHHHNQEKAFGLFLLLPFVGLPWHLLPFDLLL
jgi:hypothetical protein